MSYRISKRFAFSASHQLDTLGGDHPCARLHGHNYEVEIVSEAGELDEHGFVHDYRAYDELKRFLDRVVDHRHLNDVVTGPPTAEVLARWLHDWCVANFPAPVAARLAAVRVSETPSTWAEYRP